MTMADWFKRAGKKKTQDEDFDLWLHEDDDLEIAPEHKGALESNAYPNPPESDSDFFFEDDLELDEESRSAAKDDMEIDRMIKEVFDPDDDDSDLTFEELVEQEDTDIAVREGIFDAPNDNETDPLGGDCDLGRPTTSTTKVPLPKLLEIRRNLDRLAAKVEDEPEWSKRFKACSPTKQETHVSPGSDRYQDYRTLTDAIQSLQQTLSDVKAKRDYIQKSYPEDDLLTAELSRIANLLAGHYKPPESGRENPAMSILNLERDYYRTKALEAEKELSDKIREHNAQKRNNWISRPAFVIASEAAEQLDRKIINHINACKEYEVPIDHDGILPKTIAQFLKKGNVDTLKKLALMTTRELLGVPQIGLSRADTIVTALSKHNILCRSGVKSSVLLGIERPMTNMDGIIAVHWNTTNRINSHQGDWPIPGIMMGERPNDVGLDFRLNERGNTYLMYREL